MRCRGRGRLAGHRGSIQTLLVGIPSKPNAHPFLLFVPSLKNEKGLLESRLDRLPQLTSSCQPPNIINSSTILSYFKAIRPLSNDTNIDYIIDHLYKLNDGPETEVLVPENLYERKMFIFAVMHAFSTCMESLSPTKMCEASKNKDE